MILIALEDKPFVRVARDGCGNNPAMLGSPHKIKLEDA
jgi:hypothetical protein